MGTLLAASVPALAGCGPAQPPAPAKLQGVRPPAPLSDSPSQRPNVTVATPAPQPRSRLPAVTGATVRALWQGAPWADLTFDGGTLLGVDGGQVHAISAATGAPLWAATLPAAQPEILGLVPAGSVVIVEAGHATGHAPAAVIPVVFEYVALDLATGAERWAVPVTGQYRSPAITATGGYLLTGDPEGTVTARAAATGAVIWRDPRPAGCPASNLPAIPSVGLAADGAVAVASYECGRHIAVRRLDAPTGTVLWTWRSPAVPAGAGLQVSVAAVGQDGNAVLLAGQVTPTTRPIVSLLPHAEAWPQALDPALDGGVVLALNAGTGQPRWTETGGQLEAFALTDGAACEVVNAGLECRDDVSGAPVLPTLLTGQSEAGSPPYVGDGFAGVSSGLAAVTLPDRAGGVLLRVVRVRGGATVALAHLAIGTTAHGANYQVFAVAAGPLGSHAVLVLVRRVDLPGYPVLALEVPTR